MILGVNHITLAITDLKKSLAFYVDLLGLKLVGKWPRGAYLLAGDQWIALNVDANRKTVPSADYTHFAFHIEPPHFQLMQEKLKQAGVKSFQENSSEGDSFYFLDPDGHKLELHHNTLEDRLKWAKEHWPSFQAE